jgi:hypothetical protein
VDGIGGSPSLHKQMAPAEEAECGDGSCVWEAAMEDLPMEVRAFLGEGQPWKCVSSDPVDKSHTQIIPASANEDPTSTSLSAITFYINMCYDPFGSTPSPLIYYGSPNMFSRESGGVGGH